MPLHSEIKRISREPTPPHKLGAGPQRERQLVVTVELNDENKHDHEPDYYLTDDRLPALFSAFPSRPYPSTTTTTPATFTAYDADCILYDVDVDPLNSLTLIRYTYRYATNPPSGVQPGQFPEQVRRDENSGSPGSELGFSFSYSSEEIEIPYRRDAGDDPSAFNTGIPEGSQDVLNTAGDRYEQQPTRKYDVRVLTVNRLELLHRPTFWESWSHTKNAYFWNGHLPGEVCCWPVQIGAWQAHGTSLLYPVTYTFKWLNKQSIPTGMLPEIDPTTFWDDVLLSYGYQESLLEVGVLTPIYSKPGLPVRVPMPLDADGISINPPDSADPASNTYLKLLFRDFDFLYITLPADES